MRTRGSGGGHFRKRRNLEAPVFFLLRSLFPSWRFFENVGATPVIYFRYRTKEHSSPEAFEAFTEWALLPGQEVSLSPVSTPSLLRALVFNPETNLRLARTTLIEHFLAELEQWQRAFSPDCEQGSVEVTSESVARLTAYRQIALWVKQQTPPTATHTQFQLKECDSSEVIFQSEELPLFPAYFETSKTTEAAK
jgi:hypothetical protein